MSPWLAWTKVSVIKQMPPKFKLALGKHKHPFRFICAKANRLPGNGRSPDQLRVTAARMLDQLRGQSNQSVTQHFNCLKNDDRNKQKRISKKQKMLDESAEACIQMNNECEFFIENDFFISVFLLIKT